MTEFINISQLYLYEKHIPLELRINFVHNTLHWYWLKPTDIPDYCYNKIMTLVNKALHEGWYFITNIYNSLINTILKLNKILPNHFQYYMKMERVLLIWDLMSAMNKIYLIA